MSVESPCINVCRIDEATGWCDGCQRTLDEIAEWSVLDDAEKRDVWRQLAARRSEAEAEAETAAPVQPGSARR